MTALDLALTIEEHRTPDGDAYVLVRRGTEVTCLGVESLALARGAAADFEAPGAALLATLAERPAFDPARDVPRHVAQLNIGNTHHCNMACTYCYNELPTQTQKAKGTDGWMTPAVARATVDALFAQATDAAELSLVFIGGEALLQEALVRDTLAYARERGAAAGTRVDAVVYTNGLTLTEQVVAWANDEAVSLVVSLDGPPKVHDRDRLFANGKPTARRVLDNIRHFMEHTTDPVRRVRAVASRPGPLLPLHQYLYDLGFNEIHVTPAYDTGGITGRNTIVDLLALLRWYEGLLLSGVVVALEPFATQLDKLDARGESPLSWFPCGAGRTSLGISPSGGVVPCHHFVRDPKPPLASVGVALPVFDERLGLAASVREREPCRSCWARHVCGGECYHRAVTAGLPYKGVLTEACHGRRDSIAHVVELAARVAARRPEALAELAARQLTELSPNWRAFDFEDLSAYE